MNILSVDIGTSSLRASLVDSQLQIKHTSYRDIQLETDAEGKAELDVERVWEDTLACIWETLNWAEKQATPIQALSFSSASASLVCLDRHFQPIRPALTYADLRASKESQWIIETYGQTAFVQTGAPVHASYWLPKLLWLRHQGQIAVKDTRFCTIKALLIYRLTGHFMIDSCNAAALGMLDLQKIDWDDLSLEIAGIQSTQLPVIQPTTTLLKLKQDQNSLLTSFNGQARIVLGAMDGVLASLGVGAYHPGQVTTSLGSSGACRIAAATPLIDPDERRIWSYPLTKNIWIRGGAMNNGGLVTQWLAQNFSCTQTKSSQAYQEMLEAAGKVAPGADGLLFLPYLFGERAPIYDEGARGVYFGLHSSHRREHFARAGLEGILYALFSIYEILMTSQKGVGEIWANGGYVQSRLMLQIQADIFGQPILVPADLESSVIGAAALALLALDEISVFDDLEENFKFQSNFMPDKTRHQYYQEHFLKFRALYERLKTLF